MPVPSHARRTEIVRAALASFIANGIEGATIADIRTRAGATTGSVYHFFQGKDAIVAAVYLDVLRRYQVDLVRRVRRHTSARALVRGVVEHYLSWVERRTDAARFLMEARDGPAIATIEDEIARGNAAIYQELLERMRRWIETGEIRRLPLDVYLSILVGPVESFTRLWFSSRTSTSLPRARELLADAAWDALRGR